MSKMGWAAVRALVAVIGTSVLALPQEPPPLMITPEKVTLLVGDTHTFRAVGRNGRMRNVKWSVSPESAVSLSLEGSEVTLEGKEPSSNVILTGTAGGDSAQASIEVHTGPLPTGTVIWSLGDLPGCKPGQIIQAVPSGTGPDMYVKEDCPQNSVIRAVQADGREMWRTGSGAPGTHRVGSTDAQPSERLNLGGSSVCDAVSSGMTKEAAWKLVEERGLRLDEKERQSDSWTLEEDGFRCSLVFKSGAVEKKKKTIVTE
jgi:hypothetical protein